MGETFDAVGEALCRAAAIRPGSAVQVLSEQASLRDPYNLIMAGVGNIVAFLDGQELDDDVLGSAFAESWFLDARYPAEFAGHDFIRGWTSVVCLAVVLTKPKQQDIVAAQCLDFASKAAAVWPSAIRIGSFGSLARFELACQQETEDQLRKNGLPALWELAEVRSRQYRQAAEWLVA
ncbi:hypothetical protein [Streptomyces sp. TS71-3]|uniref:hypothetical protein n=1 Tax=Streptomyces sp. TS71-3 TaxID=2733862 RepID=UPI001B02197B|nr:hypothetical protein [Streptomyces sp. TS71-3]GHJ41396.1 hypothetical protein Sm713_70050 [Streptomyces sp. TS71-3]